MTVNLNNKSYLLHVKSNSHLFFFSRCPFLLNLDLIGIANRFAQFNLPAFALGTLLLVPCANKKAQQIQVRDDDEMIGTFFVMLQLQSHCDDHRCLFAVSRAFCLSVTQSLSSSRWTSLWTPGNWQASPHRLDTTFHFQLYTELRLELQFSRLFLFRLVCVCVFWHRWYLIISKPVKGKLSVTDCVKISEFSSAVLP